MSWYIFLQQVQGTKSYTKFCETQLSGVQNSTTKLVICYAVSTLSKTVFGYVEMFLPL